MNNQNGFNAFELVKEFAVNNKKKIIASVLIILLFNILTSGPKVIEPPKDSPLQYAQQRKQVYEGCYAFVRAKDIRGKTLKETFRNCSDKYIKKNNL